MRKQKPTASAARLENPAFDLHMLLGPERAYFGGVYDANLAFEPACVENESGPAVRPVLLRRIREMGRRLLGLLFTARRRKAKCRRRHAVPFGLCP